MPRQTLRFVRRGRVVETAPVEPAETVLDYLRLRERAPGTKEGCAEGDCGACTVAVGTWRNGELHYQPVNSCIALLGSIDGKVLVTVDDLAEDGELHPVQRAMVEHHASQCGFCTPGFVMSLFTLYHADGTVDRARINDWLAGNLCRCTGYRPIVDAALASCTRTAADSATGRGSGRVTDIAVEAIRELARSDSGEDLLVGDPERFFAAPRSLDALAALYADHPDAVIAAGTTDVGLWITKQLRDLPKLIAIDGVAELGEIRETAEAVEIGAGVTYARAEVALAAIDPDIGELVRRLGSKQVRAVATIGGNIANGSPIGDMPPVLIALGSSLELRERDAVRELPLEAFFIDYGKQDRRPGEFLTRISIPRLNARQAFRCYKVSKRFDQDISAVLGAFRFDLDAGAITSARVAFGGMAATPRRAAMAEAALRGVSLDAPERWQAALLALAEDFAPIDDHRASARYRVETARALLARALAEVAGEPTSRTRVVGHREAAGNASAHVSTGPSAGSSTGSSNESSNGGGARGGRP